MHIDRLRNTVGLDHHCVLLELVSISVILGTSPYECSGVGTAGSIAGLPSFIIARCIEFVAEAILGFTLGAAANKCRYCSTSVARFARNWII